MVAPFQFQIVDCNSELNRLSSFWGPPPMNDFQIVPVPNEKRELLREIAAMPLLGLSGDWYDL